MSTTTSEILAEIHQATDGKQLNRLRRQIIPAALITNTAQALCLEAVDLRFAQLNADAIGVKPLPSFARNHEEVVA